MEDESSVRMAKEYWENSPFSIVRHFGKIEICGHRYLICDKLGRDIFECSAIADREGRQKAIEPGEPVDLVLEEFIPVYRKLGREAVLKMLEQGHMTIDEAYEKAGIDKESLTTKTKNHGRKTKRPNDGNRSERNLQKRARE